MTKIKKTKEQTKQRIVCPPVIFILSLYCLSCHFYFVIVLSVLLSFLFWSLYFLSFCHFYFGHCIVCPVIFILVIVLSVLLSFLFWSLHCLSFCHFYFGLCIVCPSVIFNTMTKIKMTEGQTIQWPK
jgi:hypothetical protein